MMVEMNGDLKWKADEAIDEAYRRGYEDAKKEFIGMSAKQIQIKYHDDFATALEKMYEYEERQTETETWISMDKSRKITVPKGTFEKILSDADDDFDI